MPIDLEPGPSAWDPADPFGTNYTYAMVHIPAEVGDTVVLQFRPLLGSPFHLYVYDSRAFHRGEDYAHQYLHEPPGSHARPLQVTRADVSVPWTECFFECQQEVYPDGLILVWAAGAEAAADALRPRPSTPEAERIAGLAPYMTLGVIEAPNTYFIIERELQTDAPGWWVALAASATGFIAGVIGFALPAKRRQPQPIPEVGAAAPLLEAISDYLGRILIHLGVGGLALMAGAVFLAQEGDRLGRSFPQWFVPMERMILALSIAIPLALLLALWIWDVLRVVRERRRVRRLLEASGLA